MQRLDESDPRVFHAAAGLCIQLVRLPGLQREAQALYPGRDAGWVEGDARDADARVVALGDQAGEEIELPVQTARRGWIEHAPGLVGVAGLRLHHHAQSLQREGRRLTPCLFAHSAMAASPPPSK